MSRTTPSPSVAPTPSSTGVCVAILGAGAMARHHARAAAAAGGQVVAFSDPLPAAREAMTAVCPGATAYASADELLEAESPDAVHVCTPPATHAELALRALDAGCAVYVEKPFAESPDVARRILDRAAERGLAVCAGHQLLFEAPMRRCLELMPALGTLTHVESYFSFRPARTAAAGRVPLRADAQLFDILPHPVYSLLHALELGRPDAETKLDSVEAGPGGTLHAVIRRGDLSATLHVTLEGRPVESYLRVVGTNGVVHADFVRSTVQHAIGPGTSGIDKLLQPYVTALQLVGGTTASMASRVLNRKRSYPGLAEIFEAFYTSVRGGPPPVSRENISETVRICHALGETFDAWASQYVVPAVAAEPRVVVTGGAGFLGEALVRELRETGLGVRVLARREPAPWDRVPGADYVVVDLVDGPLESAFEGAAAVLHLAAATAGDFDVHERNSIGATESVCRAAAKAGVERVVIVSSLAVLDSSQQTALSEDTPLESSARERGPYVWGKLESERRAVELGRELGLEVKIARPGPIVDAAVFDPPGRLGRRLGPIFVAMGPAGDPIPFVDRGFAARALRWIVLHWAEAPPVLNLLAPELPTRRELVARLRQQNPGIRVIWLPKPVLAALSWLASGAQRLLRPGREPVDVAKAFGADAYDTGLIRALEARIEAVEGATAPPSRPAKAATAAPGSRATTS